MQNAGFFSAYITKEVPFKFRGIDFRFALSQGLFSSAGVDAGTRFLLKVFSTVLDADIAAGRPPPRRVLDSGCGAGVIAVCAAAVLARNGGQPLARAQDRDELARLITLYNAEKNGLPPGTLEAFAEPLLAGPPDTRWDLILTNIPAKAGAPVLEDFVRRSTALLNHGGRVIMVAVRTLADFFRERIRAAGAELEREETGAEHSVLAYRRAAATQAAVPFAANEPVRPGEGFLRRYPFYVRAATDYSLEDMSLRLETVYGASGFDTPGGAALAAAKLIRRLGAAKLPVFSPDAAALIHEPGQGFFSRWLAGFPCGEGRLPQAAEETPGLVLSGRNILALEAARHNTAAVSGTGVAVTIVPAVDLRLGAGALLKAAGGRRYGFIAAFPELLPQNLLSRGTDQLAALWEALPPLLAGGGVFIAGLGSTDAERFDRKKQAGFTRLGDIKRNRFRALAYQWSKD